MMENKMSEENIIEQETPEIQPEPEEPIAFIDKVIGIFTSPGDTMEKISQKPPKVLDWIIPVIIMIVIMFLSSWLTDQNASIKSQKNDYELKVTEKSFNMQVEAGALTQEKVDELLDNYYYAKQKDDPYKFIKLVGSLVFGIFLIFFLVNIIFFLLSRFILKGEGTYNNALVAYGFAYYILILQVILNLVLMLATEEYYLGFGLSNFFNVESFSFAEFVLRKLDPFVIWFYAVLGISLAKMFKSKDTTKFVISVFAVWIGFSLLFYYISTLSPYFFGFRFM
jgi:hypothetical protein